MAPPLTKLSVSIKKKEENKNNNSSDSNSPTPTSSSPAPITASSSNSNNINNNAPTSSATASSKASGALARLRTFSANTSKKRSASLSSKISLSDSGSLINFNLQEEKSISFIDDKKLNSLQKAVYENDLRKVRKLLSEANRDTDKLDSVHQMTALYTAVVCNNLDMARLLLTSTEGTFKKADPNVSCLKGRTSLMRAVINENLDMVNLLLANGADVNKTDDWNCKALTYTLFNNSIDIFKLLMQLQKDNLQYTDSSKMTLLHHAARLGRADIASVLLENGHEVDARDDLDRTPLHVAVKEKQVNVVGLLLSNKANVEAQDMNCQTVLDYFSYSSFSQELWNILQEYRALYKSTLSLAKQVEVPANENSQDNPSENDQNEIDQGNNRPKSYFKNEAEDKKHNALDDDELSSVVSVSDHFTEAVKQDGHSLNVTSEKYQSIIEKMNQEIATLSDSYSKEKELRQAQEANAKKAAEKLRILEKELDELYDMKKTNSNSKNDDQESHELIKRIRAESEQKDQLIEDLESTANYLSRQLRNNDSLRLYPLREVPSQKSFTEIGALNINPNERKIELAQRVEELENLLSENDNALAQTIIVPKTHLDQINQRIRNTRDSVHEISKNQQDSAYAVSPNTQKQGFTGESIAESILQSVKCLSDNMSSAKQGIEKCLTEFQDSSVIEVFNVQLATMHDLISTWQKDTQWIGSNIQAFSQIQKSEKSSSSSQQNLTEGQANSTQEAQGTASQMISYYNSAAHSRSSSVQDGQTAISTLSLKPRKSFASNMNNLPEELEHKDQEERIKTLDGVRRRHEATITKYEKEIEVLKAEIQELRADGSDHKVNALQQKLASQSIEYENNLAVIKATLESDVRRLEDEVSKLRKERDGLYSQVQQLSKELDVAKTESEKNTKLLKEERESTKNILARKEEILHLAEANKEAMLKENEELKDQLSHEHAEARAKINKLEREQIELLGQVKKIQDIEDDYSKQINLLQEEISQLKVQNDTLHQEYMQEVIVLQEEKTELSHHLEEFKSEAQTLQSKIAQLVQSSESMSSTHTVLLQAKEKDIQALCLQMDQLEKEKQDLVRDKGSISQTLEQKTKEILEFISRIQDLESSLERERAQVLELRKNIEHLQEQTRKIDDLQRETAELQVYQQRASLLQNQLVTAQEQLESKESQYREAQQLKLEYETQVQSLTQDLVAKDRRLQDLIIQCDTLSQKQSETSHLETMLHQQHEEMLTQLRKYGLDLSMSFQQGASTLNSFEMYLHAEKEARGLYEKQLTQMQDKHNEQMNQYKTSMFDYQKKLSLLEMKQSSLEKDLVDRKVAYSVLNEKWIHLESKNADLLRKNSGLLHEMTSVKADHHVQSLNLSNKIERLESENNKLKFKVQELIKEHQLRLSHLSSQYDAQIEKMVKRMQFAGQQRMSIDQSRKKNQQALLDTYEQHIKSLTNELNSLRLTALKHQVSQCRKI